LKFELRAPALTFYQDSIDAHLTRAGNTSTVKNVRGTHHAGTFKRLLLGSSFVGWELRAAAAAAVALRASGAATSTDSSQQAHDNIRTPANM
jgi:hypothetical protein